MSADAILIRGVRTFDGVVTDLLLRDGVIAERGTGLAADDAAVIEADSLIALPGFVDLHTHLREPGGEGAETVLTGSRAAAAGGYTAVHAMANTNPVADTAGVVEQVLAAGEAAGYVTVQPIGAITKGQAGEALADIGSMANSRAKVRIFSDDGICVSDSLVMRRAMEYVKTFDGVIAQHAQDPRLTLGAQLNEGPVSAELGLAGWPAVAEESIIARDIMLAELTGARYHACHVSTAGSVELIRQAKAKGLPVTAEVTPHHLILTDELARGYNPFFKVNPPLRSAKDVEAVRAALADGTIDIVATDHAPHKAELKCCEWDQAAMGMVGLESALAVVQTAMVETGLLDWAGVARVMSQAPARISGLVGHGGSLQLGEAANLTLVDPAAEREFTTDELQGKGRNSPYLGRTVRGAVVTTIHHGIVTLRDGILTDPDTVAAQARQRRAQEAR